MDLSLLPWVLVGALILFKLAGMYRSPARLAELARALDEGGLLVDVRSPAEYGAGHAPGAVNVPLGTEDQHLDRLGPKDRPLVVHCASGTRSMAAVRRLRAAGYTRVYDAGTLGNARKLRG